MNIVYRPIEFSETEIKLFSSFERKQDVTDCRRKINGQWRIISAPFIDDWNERDYAFLAKSLKNTVKAGGFVYGKLKGFVSVDGTLFGTEGQYADLIYLYVAGCLRLQKNMLGKRGRKSYIFRRIRRSKHRLFIKLWGA